MKDFVIEGVLERDIITICRICLKNDGTVSVFSESESENKFILRERIMSFAYVEIFEGDGLPSQLCKKCFTQINIAFKLKAQCECADYFLRQQLCISETATEEKPMMVNDFEEFMVENNEEFTTEGVEELYADLPTPSDKPIKNNIQFSTKYKTSQGAAKELKIVVPSAENTMNNGISVKTNSSKPAETAEESIDTREDHEVKDPLLIHNHVPLVILNTKNSNLKKKLRPRKRGRLLEGQTEVHRCTFCEKVFPFEGNLRNHILKDHEPLGEFPCLECGNTFPHKVLLDMHVKIHTAERPHICSFCGKSFMTLSTLQSHERNHRLKKSFLCNHCGKLFCANQRHICPVINSNRERRHLCNVCGKKFFKQSTLTTHRKRHRSVERFRCKICSKPFFSNQELERHTNVHLGVRPFACNLLECELTFYTQGELNRHLRYHRGEKNFKCDQCERSFFESGHLLKHKRKHTGERPYICEVCSKSFTDASKLKRHVKIHYNTSSACSSKTLSKINNMSNTEFVADTEHTHSTDTSWVILNGEEIELQNAVILDSVEDV